jgi:hypothetical protein
MKKNQSSSKNQSPNKKIYEVEENETISHCLARMERDGYVPTKRTEKPVFQEIMEENEKRYIPVGRQILFEAKRGE